MSINRMILKKKKKTKIRSIGKSKIICIFLLLVSAFPNTSNADVYKFLDQFFLYVESYSNILLDSVNAKDIFVVEVTAYSMGTITASGKEVKEGYVAISRDLIEKYGFGEKVIFYEIKENGIYIRYGEYKIEDKMGPNIKNTFDIYMSKRKDALQFGRKNMMAIIRK